MLFLRGLFFYRFTSTLQCFLLCRGFSVISWHLKWWRWRQEKKRLDINSYRYFFCLAGVLSDYVTSMVCHRSEESSGGHSASSDYVHNGERLFPFLTIVVEKVFQRSLKIQFGYQTLRKPELCAIRSMAGEFKTNLGWVQKCVHCSF